jgi:hypothetical protein
VLHVGDGAGLDGAGEAVVGCLGWGVEVEARRGGRVRVRMRMRMPSGFCSC